jgi:hypothetical protein
MISMKVFMNKFKMRFVDDRANGFIDKNSVKDALLAVLLDEQVRKAQAGVNAA